MMLLSIWFNIPFFLFLTLSYCAFVFYCYKKDQQNTFLITDGILVIYSLNIIVTNFFPIYYILLTTLEQQLELPKLCKLASFTFKVGSEMIPLIWIAFIIFRHLYIVNWEWTISLNVKKMVIIIGSGILMTAFSFELVTMTFVLDLPFEKFCYGVEVKF